MMTTRPLDARDFLRIQAGGFGDLHNSRAQSLGWFQNRLYVGVTRHPPQRRDEASAAERWPGGPRNVNQPPRSRYIDQHAEIWRYDPSSGEWDRVFVSPLVELPNKNLVARDAGYRKMIVFQGSRDPVPALYVSSLSICGSLILRSDDGHHFTPVSRPGPGTENSWSFRAFASLNGRLHTSPAGRMNGELIERNVSDVPLVFSSADPVGDRWRVDSELGFGDPANCGVYELAPFQDALYAATCNSRTGFQIWRTGADSYPYQWRQVLAEGASRGAANEGVPTMCVFGDALYVGTGKQAGNASRGHRTGRVGAELIRLDQDGNWDLIVGESRNTFQGWKAPLSGIGPGFDDPYNTEILELVEHDGWLYAGTGNTGSVLLLLLQGYCGWWRRRRIDAVLKERGGFDLWRSRDGTSWEMVTCAGFGNPRSASVASTLSTPAGLVIGTGTLPDVTGSIEGPGGCEIWLGKAGRARRSISVPWDDGDWRGFPEHRQNGPVHAAGAR